MVEGILAFRNSIVRVKTMNAEKAADVGTNDVLIGQIVDW